MDRCEVCRNEYEGGLEIKEKKTGTIHYFDSFECAISRLAPHCLHCDVMILGHGVQVGDQVFCGANCARLEGCSGVVDHAAAQTDLPLYV